MPLDQLDIDKRGDQKEMSFLDHLEELRWHIIRSVIAIAVVAIVVFLAKDFVFKVVIFGPKQGDFITYRIICAISDTLCFRPPEFQILTRDLGEQFITHIKTSILLGIVLAFPYIFWEFWRFVKPGLLEREATATRWVVLICSLLFMLGVLFGYYVLSPFAVSFLAAYDVGATSAPTLTSYVNYMTMFTLPTGIVFEMPVVVYFLAQLGILGPEPMKKYRKHAIIAILILAAIITPPDVITQFIIAIPLYGLYEISIIIARRVYKEV